MIEYDNLLATSELQNIELLYNYAWYLSFDDKLANEITLETVSSGLRFMASNQNIDNSKFAWFKRIHQIISKNFAEELKFCWEDGVGMNVLRLEEHPLDAFIFPPDTLDKLDFESWQICLENLPMEKRVFILLNDIEQFNYAQIGEILNISVLDVTEHLYLARQIFHQLLQKQT